MKPAQKFFAIAALVAFAVCAVLHAPAADAAVPTGQAAQAVTDATLAAPKWAVTLTTDGGSSGLTQVACLSSINQTIQLEVAPAANFPGGPEYCFKTCTTSTCVPDCTKDFMVNVATTETESMQDAGTTFGGIVRQKHPSINSDLYPLGQDKCIAAMAADAGQVRVRVFYHTKNP